jgi:hypothetical protein
LGKYQKLYYNVDGHASFQKIVTHSPDEKAKTARQDATPCVPSDAPTPAMLSFKFASAHDGPADLVALNEKKL